MLIDYSRASWTLSRFDKCPEVSRVSDAELTTRSLQIWNPYTAVFRTISIIHEIDRTRKPPLLVQQSPFTILARIYVTAEEICVLRCVCVCVAVSLHRGTQVHRKRSHRDTAVLLWPRFPSFVPTRRQLQISSSSRASSSFPLRRSWAILILELPKYTKYQSKFDWPTDFDNFTGVKQYTFNDSNNFSWNVEIRILL